MAPHDDVMATALTEAGVGQCDEPSFGEALDVPMRAFVQKSQVKARGQAVMDRGIIRHPSGCLEASVWYRPHPDAADVPSLSSRFRTGAPRTAATALSMCFSPWPPCPVRRRERARPLAEAE